jgi:hypothetical protein
MMSGFFIRKLELDNHNDENVKPSKIKFEKGLNIVYGGSNIGKTFIYQCIDYMLGGEEQPKAIKESKDYVLCQLDIETYDGEQYVLKRELRGSFFTLEGKDIFKDNKKSILAFLLKITKMEAKNIRIDNNGEVGELDLEKLKKYFMIDEDAILVKKSHIMGKTIKDKNSFKFLITQKDDSKIKSKTPKSNFDKEEAQIKILEEDILLVDKEIKELTPIGLFNIETQLQSIQDAIFSKTKELNILQESIIKEYEERLVCPLCKQSLGVVKFQEIISHSYVKHITSTTDEENEKRNKLEEELKILGVEKQELEEKIAQLNNLEDIKRKKEKRIIDIRKKIEDSQRENEVIVYPNINTSNLKSITKTMLDILTTINFEKITSVEFLEKDLDFSVNGDSRELYGQGYRAIIYTSFLVAILEYLYELESEIGFMMIDSPFNAYEIKSDNIDLAYNFYHYLAFGNQVISQRQVIFFENTEPNDIFDDSRCRFVDSKGFLLGRNRYPELNSIQ